MTRVAATIAIWLIAVLVTLAMVKDSGVFTYLWPLYGICMIGSVSIARSALGRRGGEPAI